MKLGTWQDTAVRWWSKWCCDWQRSCPWKHKCWQYLSMFGSKRCKVGLSITCTEHSVHWCCQTDGLQIGLGRTLQMTALQLQGGKEMYRFGATLLVRWLVLNSMSQSGKHHHWVNYSPQQPPLYCGLLESVLHAKFNESRDSLRSFCRELM
jgi:hypothetical protein